MKYKDINFTIKQAIAFVVYKLFLTWLPSSETPFIGNAMKKIRYHCCKHIFLYCGKNVNIERRAKFGIGFGVKIGDNSGIGINCSVPGDIEIGKNVMMAPECYILPYNHTFDRTDIPMTEQTEIIRKKTIIEDDIWIGRQVIFTPGRHVKTGSIIGAGCVLTKDFEPYSIVAGNPARLIRVRK